MLEVSDFNYIAQDQAPTAAGIDHLDLLLAALGPGLKIWTRRVEQLVNGFGNTYSYLDKRFFAANSSVKS